MTALVDLHVHLLAGMDDGPRSQDDAVAMCRLSHAEGVRLSVALAHQNESWPAVSPDGIRAAAAGLARVAVAAGRANAILAAARTAGSWRVESGDPDRVALLLLLPQVELRPQGAVLISFVRKVPDADTFPRHIHPALAPPGFCA